MDRLWFTKFLLLVPYLFTQTGGVFCSYSARSFLACKQMTKTVLIISCTHAMYSRSCHDPAKSNALGKDLVNFVGKILSTPVLARSCCDIPIYCQDDKILMLYLIYTQDCSDCQISHLYEYDNLLHSIH